MVCVPTERTAEKEPPVPIMPLRLEFQLKLAVTLPCSVSLALPVNGIKVPTTKDEPSPGPVIVTLGDVLAGGDVVRELTSNKSPLKLSWLASQMPTEPPSDGFGSTPVTSSSTVMLLRLADIFATETETYMKRLVTLIEPSLIILIGCFVAFVVISLLSAILEINALAI